MNSYVDTLVIGAGITGAGVAYSCAALGFSVLLVDKAPGPGLATSNNSSKLIHGGLRYLESGQWHLVRECLIERSCLLKAAPDLVQLSPFYLPIYDYSRRGLASIGLGLGLYSLLGWGLPGRDFGWLPRNQWSQIGIETQGLKGVWRYWDGQTDDHQLCLRVVRAAEHFGAKTHWQCPVVDITPLVNGYRVQLGNGQQVHCRTLVNAAGPWVNRVASLSNQLPQAPIRWVQGSHLVLQAPPPPACLYTESPDDGRPVFILPWQGKTLVGTTEVDVTSPDSPSATAGEVDYLMRTYQRICPMNKSTDLVGQYCGLRVLPASKEVANRASRDVQLVSSLQAPGYVAVYGGKLTSFRATALKVVDALSPFLPRTPVLNTPALQQPRF